MYETIHYVDILTQYCISNVGYLLSNVSEMCYTYLLRRYFSKCLVNNCKNIIGGLYVQQTA